MLKNIFQFIKSRAFLLSVGIYLVLLLIGILGVLSWMNSYTNHDETIKTPSFTGVYIDSLDSFVKDKDIKYQIIDSIYDPSSPPGVVISQEPIIDEEVKAGRIIYLYVTSVSPPKVSMPQLVDRSLRHAAAILVSYGLTLGKTEFVPDHCSNCILKQRINGKEISSGSMVRKGAVIDLVIGKGLSDEEVNVPCFYGLTTREAMKKLSEVSLSLGAISYDNPRDSAASVIYRQTPDYDKETSLNMGEAVDLYFTTDKKKIPSTPKD